MRLPGHRKSRTPTSKVIIGFNRHLLGDTTSKEFRAAMRDAKDPDAVVDFLGALHFSVAAEQDLAGHTDPTDKPRLSAIANVACSAIAAVLGLSARDRSIEAIVQTSDTDWNGQGRYGYDGDDYFTGLRETLRTLAADPSSYVHRNGSIIWEDGRTFDVGHRQPPSAVAIAA